MLAKVQSYRYEILLFFLLIVIFAPDITSKEIQRYIVPIVLLLNALAALNISKKVNTAFYLKLISLIAAIITAGIGLKTQNSFAVFSYACYFIFYILTTLTLFREIITEKAITVSVLLAVVCGFVLLILNTAFCFALIAYFDPNAFKGLDQPTFNDLLYFSFVTVSTIGYGDIAPASRIARKTVMLFSMITMYYNLFIVSIMVSKFLNQRKSN